MVSSESCERKRSKGSSTERRSARTMTSSCSLFFSSRRRHTRFDCDWSSDVCSSDLWCWWFMPPPTCCGREYCHVLDNEAGHTPRMRPLILAAVILMRLSAADAFDLQGDRKSVV